MIAYGTCVIVGIILATPEKTSIYYVETAYGNVAHLSLSKELALLTYEDVKNVHAVEGLPRLPPRGYDSIVPCGTALRLANGGLY